MKKLNVNQIKYIAAFFMVLDNLYLAIPGLPGIFHLITRFVAPIFGFFVVEGFFHTRNRIAYMTRLWIAAIILQGISGLSFVLLGKAGFMDNIFLTMAIGFTMMFVLESIKQKFADKNALKIFLMTLTVIACYFVGFFTEGGAQVLAVIAIFYLFYGDRKKQVIVFLIWNALFLFTSLPALPQEGENLAAWWEMFCYNSDAYTFLFLPFVFLYNGQKGKKSAFNRYFFYIFYPLHLWIIALIKFFFFL